MRGNPIDEYGSGERHSISEAQRTRRANGALRSSRSVDFWYLLISRNATVPALKRCFFAGAIGSPAAEAVKHVRQSLNSSSVTRNLIESRETHADS